MESYNVRKEYAQIYVYYLQDLKEYEHTLKYFKTFLIIYHDNQYEHKTQHQIPFRQRNEHLYLNVQKNQFATQF